ncbi:MAG: TonB-dependent receptor [Bacteroidota bacterium]
MRKNKSAFLSTGCLVIYFSIFWAGLTVPAKLNAQDSGSRDTADSMRKQIDLKEVAININKISRRQTSSTPLQILSGKDLLNLGNLSVADAMRFLSGVQVKDYGGIGGMKTINVRSLGTNHTGVFYDGVELGNAQNGQVDLGKFSLENLDEIEIYNGQRSSIFQPAKSFTSGSSIYLNTKKPVFREGSSWNAVASLKFGSFGLVNPSLLIQNKISDALSISSSAEYTKASGRYKFRYTNGVFDTTAFRNNGDVERFRLELGLRGNLKDSSKLSARVYIYTDQMGLPGAIVSNKFDNRQRTWNNNGFIQSTYKKQILSRYSILGTFKVGFDNNRYLDPESVSLNGFLDNTYKQQDLYVSLAQKYVLSKILDVALATDYQYNTLDANIFQFSFPSRSTILITMAAQMHLNRFDLQANLNATFANDKVKDGSEAGSNNNATPAILMSWQPFSGKEFRIRTFYKSVYRLPTFNDLYYTDFRRTYLRPELANQYNLGLTYIKVYNGVLKQISFQTDAYFNDIKDKIVAVPGNNAQRWSVENIGDVEVKGIEINLQSSWSLGSITFNSALNYTHQNAVDLTLINNPSYERQLPYIPKHSGSFVAGSVFHKLSVNYSFIYTGERYNQKANTSANYVQPWYTHDISLRYKTAIEHKSITMGADVSNLFNQYYDVIANFPMPGRSYRFTLNFTY